MSYQADGPVCSYESCAAVTCTVHMTFCLRAPFELTEMQRKLRGNVEEGGPDRMASLPLAG